MARTPTVQMQLGYKAPAFSLPNVLNNEIIGYDLIRGERGTVVMFICNHCPFVVHVMEELIRLGNDYRSRGIGFVAISSNDISTHPDDSPQKMALLARSKNFPFPYLFDETQQVAKDYTAACTPDFSVFDADDRCVYRGQLDDSRPGNGVAVTGKDLRLVLDQLVAQKAVAGEQKPSIGCNIKWRAGNEPAYY